MHLAFVVLNCLEREWSIINESKYRANFSYRDVSDILIGGLRELEQGLFFIDPTDCVFNELQLGLNHPDFLNSKQMM